VNGCYTGKQVIGSLLKGGSLLFGKPVELSWPEGLPHGMTGDGLRDIGEQMAGDRGPCLIPAGSEFCAVTVRCGRELADGECERRGRQDAVKPRRTPAPGQFCTWKPPGPASVAGIALVVTGECPECGHSAPVHVGTDHCPVCELVWQATPAFRRQQQRVSGIPARETW